MIDENEKKFREKLSKRENIKYDGLLLKYHQDSYEQMKADWMLTEFEYSRNHQDRKWIKKADFKEAKKMNVAVAAHHLTELESIRNSIEDRKESENINIKVDKDVPIPPMKSCTESEVA